MSTSPAAWHFSICVGDNEKPRSFYRSIQRDLSLPVGSDDQLRWRFCVYSAVRSLIVMERDGRIELGRSSSPWCAETQSKEPRGLPVVELKQAPRRSRHSDLFPITVVVGAMRSLPRTWCGRGAAAPRFRRRPAAQMPEHTRGRDELHVEAATTGFVSQGLREVRLSDTRQTRSADGRTHHRLPFEPRRPGQLACRPTCRVRAFRRRRRQTAIRAFQIFE